MVDPMPTANHVLIQVDFSWQGETYHPAARLDLDKIVANGDELPDLHALLAQLSNIDPYSYQYEVLYAHEITFSEPEGLAVDFLSDGQFDFAGFALAWREQQLQRLLGRIARQYLGVDDLAANPALQQALHAAWQLGKHPHQE